MTPIVKSGILIRVGRIPKEDRIFIEGVDYETLLELLDVARDHVLAKLVKRAYCIDIETSPKDGPKDFGKRTAKG
jgi:hypothetical protein